MFCGFWKDQRKIGAVRELEADWKYYDAADDEGEVQCDIPISTKAIASSYYSHSRFLEIVEFHMYRYGEAMAKSRSPEPM
ncbi:unnamed protein product [Sphagnum jensenii]|uniref:Uncharacterized protein n=1 Tax=Sphagnum jensenii TaxID=128206 RepID=A0ABP0X7U2_9BRYO